MAHDCNKEREIGEIGATVRAIETDLKDVRDDVKAVSSKLDAITPEVIISKCKHQQTEKRAAAVWAIFLVLLSAGVSYVVSKTANLNRNAQNVQTK